jgi:hypothetical protein
MTIDVTAQDIRAGSRHSSIGCPIALACVRQLGRAVAVTNWHLILGPIGMVTAESTKTFLHQKTVAVALPDGARRFIHAFDGCEPVEPFGFSIDLPASIAATIDEHELVPA